MGQRLIGVATLFVALVLGAIIIIDLGKYPQLINNISSIWKSGVQAASGQAIS